MLFCQRTSCPFTFLSSDRKRLAIFDPFASAKMRHDRNGVRTEGDKTREKGQAARREKRQRARKPLRVVIRQRRSEPSKITFQLFLVVSRGVKAGIN